MRRANGLLCNVQPRSGVVEAGGASKVVLRGGECPKRKDEAQGKRCGEWREMERVEWKVGVETASFCAARPFNVLGGAARYLADGQPAGKGWVIQLLVRGQPLGTLVNFLGGYRTGIQTWENLRTLR